MRGRVVRGNITQEERDRIARDLAEQRRKESTPHISPEPAALVELAIAVGQWLGAESAPVDVICAQERVVEWAQSLGEQYGTLAAAVDDLLSNYRETVDDHYRPKFWQSFDALRELRGSNPARNHDA